MVDKSSQSLNRPLIWALHSPDLSSSDLFVVVTVKCNVNRDEPILIEKLNTKIQECIRETDRAICKRVMENLVKRFRVCILLDSGNIEYLLWFRYRCCYHFTVGNSKTRFVELYVY